VPRVMLQTRTLRDSIGSTLYKRSALGQKTGKEIEQEVSD